MLMAIVVASGVALAACSATDSGSPAVPTSSASGILVVAVDDSLAAAFAVAKTAYEAVTPRATLNFRFAPSAVLRKSIEAGDPIDLFFAGDLATAQAIVADRLAAGPAAPFVVSQAGDTSAVVILARSPDVLGAAAFVRWLGGPDGRAILAKFGLAAPPP